MMPYLLYPPSRKSVYIHKARSHFTSKDHAALMNLPENYIP